MATFFIKHLTKYTYSSAVIDGAILTRLHPIDDGFQKVTSHLISITNNAYIETFLDFYNNRVGTFMVTEPHETLSIISEIEVTTYTKLFPDDTIDITLQWNELKRIKKTIDYIDFIKPISFKSNEDIKSIILDKMLKTKSPFKAVLELCEFVYHDFEYKSGITNVNTPLEEAWELKVGVCQDFANVLIQMIKLLGIPARYVSGYICPNENISRGEGATHAWVEAYIPFYGWLGIDPTNNTIANDNHVRLAIGRDYNDCSPVKGVFKGYVEAEMQVNVEISSSKSQTPFTIESNIVNTETNNSYQRNLELMQLQQQQ